MIYLYKFIGSFVQFPGILILTFLIFTIYFFIKKRRIWCFFLILTVFFYLISSPFFVYFLSKFFYVESSNSKIEIKDGIIVILGGGITQYNGNYEIGCHTLERLLKGFEVYKETRFPIIVTGGVIGKGYSEAYLMRDILLKFGVEERDIIIEDKARTTKENAIYVSKMLKEKDIENVLLVTSYLHMKRSYMLFEKYLKQNIIPIVCDYPIDFRNSFLDYLPSSNALYVFSQITHEMIGILKGG